MRSPTVIGFQSERAYLTSDVTQKGKEELSFPHALGGNL